MQRFILSLTVALTLLAGTGCVGTAEIDLTGEEASSIVTSLHGRFLLPDGSPAGGAKVTARYGKQSVSTVANSSGEFVFPRWNILGYPGEVEGELTDEGGHLWYTSMEFRSLGDGSSSVFVGEEELKHTTAIIGRTWRPDWILGPAWCELTGGGMTAKFTTDHQGNFRVERWPSDAQPITLKASAGDRPNVWAQGSTGPFEFSPDAAEFDLGELKLEELPAITPARGGMIGSGM